MYRIYGEFWNIERRMKIAETANDLFYNKFDVDHDGILTRFEIDLMLKELGEMMGNTFFEFRI